MNTTIGASIIENAKHISEFVANLVTDDGVTISNRESVSATMLATAMFCRYFQEDKETMMRMFSLMLEACDEIPLNDEE
jgi:hypothetical protein